MKKFIVLLGDGEAGVPFHLKLIRAKNINEANKQVYESEDCFICSSIVDYNVFIKEVKKVI